MGRLKQHGDVSTTTRKLLPNGLLEPYKPGQCGNPNGRPMGSRQKLTDTFIKDLANHYEREGHKAIERVLDENPVAYLQIICRLLPKDISLTVSNDLSNTLPPDQLKRIAEAWMLSQQDDDSLEGESVVVSSETAALPAPVDDPMLSPLRVKEPVREKREFDDDGDTDPDKPRKRSTRPVVRRQ
ncbi:MAG: hypothetical protein IPL99_15510 [Candidatus Competibacteraceae bacterium]|nr:hypothetical protein [Candidatus Competibacteraceae bacterium]